MQTDQTGENKTGEKSEGGEDAKKEEVIGCIYTNFYDTSQPC